MELGLLQNTVCRASMSDLSFFLFICCTDCYVDGSEPVISATDVNGNVTTYQYDGLGQLCQLQDPGMNLALQHS